MSEEQRHLRDHARVDDGLKAAFGDSGGSVLDAIERLSGTRSQVLLRDGPEDASPVLRRVGPAAEGVVTDDSRYQVLGEIGRGGMGTVYKGRDKDLGRDVALKVLRADLAEEAAVVQRFVEEAQVGGQLQHPGIVPIYGIGLQKGGRPYFAMKLVKGETLASLLEGGKKGSELIGIFERVAQTVAYAHSRGVIHRDLKPSNVMVGAFGEVHVVDWGFAKVLGREETHGRPGATIVATVRTGAEGSQSVAGSVMGTPAYMPPEQAMGQIEELTERSDVFALGAILCEILTRQPPYTGTMQDQILAAAQARLEEAHGRIDACSAPDALKRLARDCMAPLPKDRPKDAAAVAQRVAEHLASVEERARQAEIDAVHAAAEGRRVQRGRRTTVVLAGVALAAILGGSGGAYAWSRAERARASEAAAQVSPVLRGATRHEGEANWPAAKAAAATARALAETGGADAETLATVRALGARIEAGAATAAALDEKAAREAKLIGELDERVLESADHSSARFEADFAAAFATFGVDPDDEGAAAALSAFGRREELAVHLDRWTDMRRKRRDERWGALVRLASALDDDPWRARLRHALLAGDAGALRDLASAGDLADQKPATVTRLAVALWGVGDAEAASTLLREAGVRHPGDFWVRHELASLLCWHLRRPREALPHAVAAVALRPESPGAWNLLGSIRSDGTKDHDGALRAFRKAIELDPGTAAVFVGNVGAALLGKGDLDGALAALHESLRLDPSYAWSHCTVGCVLMTRRDFDGAIAAFRESLRLDPNAARSHYSLGNALKAKGDVSGAIAAYREAIRLDPRSLDAHVNLGGILCDDLGRYDEAIASFREAVRLDPNHALAHANLGTALMGKGDLDGAIAAQREAIRCDPAFAAAHCQLGMGLYDKGDLDGALAEQREAVRLDPNDARAHCNLGRALQAKADFDGAIAAQREAIRLEPNLFPAHANLGIALLLKGDFEGAVGAFRRAEALAPGEPSIREPWAKAERFAAIEHRLPAVLRGDDEPASADEWAVFAEILYLRKDYASAVRFYAKCFETDPRLAADIDAAHRYIAGCCAALAGREWHDQAVAWLRAELEANAALLATAPPAVAWRMRHWKSDRDLAAVRDSGALPGEWRRLWVDVNALLARAEEASK